jgi:putative nucleotidyltransferase with HDIG domain
MKIMSIESELLCDQVIQALLVALDQRDPETAEHCQRVSELAVRFGMELGLTENELIALRRGALLHDIGKICIPDAVLYKSGKLTDQEYERIKSHTILGARILRPLEFLERALTVVESHHECWDGTGYPQGLRGDEIPLLARISAIAGSYDALKSARSYKPGMSQSEALQFIRERASKAYDPQLVNVFLRMM